MKICKRKVILIVLSIFVALAIVSAYGEVLTWQDCLREALQNNPDLLSAKEKINQTLEEKKITRSTLLPQITAGLSSKKSRTTTKDVSSTYSYNLTGKQLLFDGFKTIYDIKSASLSVEAAEYEYREVSSSVRFNLREAFVNLLKAQKLVSLTEEIAQRRKKNLELVRLRYEVGREHKGSLLTAQASLAQAEFEVTQAKRNLVLAQRKLLKELGRERFSPIVVKEEFDVKIEREVPDFERLVLDVPEFKKAVVYKNIAGFNLKSVRADFSPVASLTSSIGRTSSDWPPEDEEWSVGVSVSFPLFEGGSRIAEVSKARSQLKEKEAEEKSLRDSFIFTLQEAWVEFQDAFDKVNVQKKYLEAAKERAKIASAQYSTGLVSFDDWTIIEDNLANAQKAYLNARAEALIAKAWWIKVKGGILEDEVY
ncbi:MAG: TolC family protein [Candidatus Omnitrophota bacterium]|nr:MAG: TolC family protein [Candidatus Omnitrophota bacterium]RKY44452.1 MAG: TolC family protein [Candidatus Omnitrophota bacterium]